MTCSIETSKTNVLVRRQDGNHGRGPYALARQVLSGWQCGWVAGSVKILIHGVKVLALRKLLSVTAQILCLTWRQLTIGILVDGVVSLTWMMQGKYPCLC